ncbi:hypothetical protein XU18_2188 [Perkinsela sp. CCAP 1560/4]|nr:hypothetical protein XU18_2188 [Perkinsela sp. CCAP 1560/4]|eukprot:KNH07143.1 hypothetical protein XU18_2188 [Perkinsela sp. CCAP 1560/4]
MGIQRLQGYLSKYFFEAFQEIREANENVHEKCFKTFPQQAVYLIDVSNLLNQKLNVQDVETSCLWEKIAPLLDNIAMRGLSTLLGKLKDCDDSEIASSDTGSLNKIVLFYDTRGDGKSVCQSFQSDLWNRWKEAIHNCGKSKPSSRVILDRVNALRLFNVSVCKNPGDSADRMIFLTHQTIRSETRLPVLIVSNDSDMLIYTLQNMHVRQSKLTNLCMLPSAYSLFEQRASAHRSSETTLFRYFHIQLDQLERRIPKIYMTSFVCQLLILLGTSASSGNISRKRDRAKKDSSLGFQGILTYHKNDITIYRTLYSSWNFLLKEMQGKKGAPPSENLLVRQTDTAVTINLLVMKRMLVEIGPSVFQGSDSPKNAENYLRAVASNLHYYTTGVRWTRLKVDTVEIPSLVAICSLLKKSSDFTFSTATLSSPPMEKVVLMGLSDE